MLVSVKLLTDTSRPNGRFFLLCSFFVYMTSSIPDGISFSDLEALRENAPTEETATPETDGPTYDGKTQDEVIEIAQKCVQQAIDECNDPMVHKIMVLEMLENMIRWHTTAGMEQDNERSTVAWLRDAGKFQAMLNILGSISCGPDDFALPE